MKGTKQAYLEQLSTEFNAEFETVHVREIRGEGEESRFQRLKRIRELHDMAEAFPVWPWDSESIGRFVGAFTSPLVIAFITIAVQAVIRN